VGQWGEQHADQLLAAANETIELWGDELDYGALADDMAVEALLALALTTEIHELEQRITVLLRDLDPNGIMTSVPGAATVNGAQILARLGNPNRFRSLAGARPFSGLVPSPQRIGRQRPPRTTHQGRRRPATRGTVHGRRPGPTDRSPSPPDTTG
jgi:transposase